jgi:hypothetical protein
MADQIVESFMADICFYLLQSLGPERAEQFKSQHFKPKQTNK